jgi:hypothetical protein
MNRSAESFVHVLLFQCPSCSNPLPSAIATTERNQEESDAHTFALQCLCGWNGTQIGLLAKRHWVESWL